MSVIVDLLAPDYFGQGPHGNGLSWLSEWALAKLEKYPDQREIIRAYWEQKVSACFVQLGLLKRGPWPKSDQEAPDDYIAVCHVSKKLGSQIGRQIYGYGVSTDGVYDNSGEKSVEAWLWRMPQVRAHMEYACGVTPPWWRRVWWAVVVATSGRPPKGEATEFDTWRLAWHLAETGKFCGLIEAVAADIFFYRFAKQYPLGMLSVSPSWKDA